jgi:hypothetical protein
MSCVLTARHSGDFARFPVLQRHDDTRRVWEAVIYSWTLRFQSWEGEKRDGFGKKGIEGRESGPP